MYDLFRKRNFVEQDRLGPVIARSGMIAISDCIMTGDKFRAQASECLKAANSTADPERKLLQLDLAQRWLRLAAQVDAASCGIRHCADPRES